jgi:hypothetical protein
MRSSIGLIIDETVSRGQDMRLVLCAAAISIGTIGLPNSSVEAATFKRVEGKVTSILVQVPQFTSIVVGGTGVSFCNHTTGDYYAITSENVHYDMLRSALTAGKSVQVGFYDFGKDPQSGGTKNCIESVTLVR